MVRREPVEDPGSRRCGHADAAEPNVHGLEVPAVGRIDVAVVALLVAEPLSGAGTHGDADVRGDDRGSTSRLVGSLLYPAARLYRLSGQHPVEQDAIGDRATEMAHPWSHGRHDDAGPLREGSRNSATACRTRWIGLFSWPDPTPTQSFIGSSPRRASSAAIWAG